MGQRIVRRATTAAALALGILVAICTPVFAFASRATHAVVVPKLAKGSATATCPTGEHVSFGGLVAQFKPPVGAGALVFPTGMRRTANNKWTVYGQSGTTYGGSRLTAVAYCDHGTAAPRIASNTVTLPALSERTATATCPAGTIAVAGGYNSGAAVNHVELLTRLEQGATTRQWLVSMLNIEKTATKLTAYAYCAPGADPTIISKVVTVPANKGATAHASCPTGTTLLFGGLLALSPGDAHHSAALEPFSWTASSTKQWDVVAYNIGDRAGYLTALAYCR